MTLRNQVALHLSYARTPFLHHDLSPQGHRRKHGPCHPNSLRSAIFWMISHEQKLLVTRDATSGIDHTRPRKKRRSKGNLNKLGTKGGGSCGIKYNGRLKSFILPNCPSLCLLFELSSLRYSTLFGLAF